MQICSTRISCNWQHRLHAACIDATIIVPHCQQCRGGPSPNCWCNSLPLSYVLHQDNSSHDCPCVCPMIAQSCLTAHQALGHPSSSELCPSCGDWRWLLCACPCARGCPALQRALCLAPLPAPCSTQTPSHVYITGCHHPDVHKLSCKGMYWAILHSQSCLG